MNVKLILAIALTLVSCFQSIGQLVEIIPLSKFQDKSVVYELIVTDKKIETFQSYAGRNRRFYSISKYEFDSIKEIILNHAIAEPSFSQLYGKEAESSVNIFIIEGERVFEFYLEEPKQFRAFFNGVSEQVKNEGLKRNLVKLKSFGSK